MFETLDFGRHVPEFMALKPPATHAQMRGLLERVEVCQALRLAAVLEQQPDWERVRDLNKELSELLARLWLRSPPPLDNLVLGWWRAVGRDGEELKNTGQVFPWFMVRAGQVCKLRRTHGVASLEAARWRAESPFVQVSRPDGKQAMALLLMNCIGVAGPMAGKESSFNPEDLEAIDPALSMGGDESPASNPGNTGDTAKIQGDSVL
jgi:hypothetical protein